MPRFVAVVGGKHSGKTTIIQHLIRQLKDRGFRVGTIKEMVRIQFVDTDMPAHDTYKHSDAGAEIVVGLPRNETAIFIKRRLQINEILPFLTGLDYVILEGFETEKTLPKIIAAKSAAEAWSYFDGLAIAVSGILAESEEEIEKASKLNVPILSSIKEAEKLADIVQCKAFETLPNLPHCGECGYGSCYEMAKAMAKGETSINKCPKRCEK